MDRRASSYHSQTRGGDARKRNAAAASSSSSSSCCGARPAVQERRPTQDTGGASAGRNDARRQGLPGGGGGGGGVTLASAVVAYEDHGSTAVVVQARPASPLEVPADFLCPITHSVMHDPVICADGHSYEREAITVSSQPTTSHHTAISKAISTVISRAVF